VGTLSIDVTRHEARIGTAALELTALEFTMLHALARHADQVLSREQLLEQVWGYDYHDDLRVVDAVIKRLRSKLRQAAPDAEWIVTVRSVGYKLSTRPDRLEED
jgi:DNA-binding response OmpR family regulator